MRSRRRRRARRGCASAPRRAPTSARAVYHVQLEDAQKRHKGEGTAWVVGANTLATNAHVALSKEGLLDGERMIVRAPGQNGTIYEVTGYTLHPGYVPFSAFLESDKREIGQFRGRSERFGGNGYDVAILTVKGTLPDSDRLTVAPPEEINDLSPARRSSRRATRPSGWSGPGRIPSARRRSSISAS